MLVHLYIHQSYVVTFSQSTCNHILIPNHTKSTINILFPTISKSTLNLYNPF